MADSRDVSGGAASSRWRLLPTFVLGLVAAGLLVAWLVERRPSWEPHHRGSPFFQVVKDTGFVLAAIRRHGVDMGPEERDDQFFGGYAQGRVAKGIATLWVPSKQGPRAIVNGLHADLLDLLEQHDGRIREDRAPLPSSDTHARFTLSYYWGMS